MYTHIWSTTWKLVNGSLPILMNGFRVTEAETVPTIYKPSADNSFAQKQYIGNHLIPLNQSCEWTLWLESGNFCNGDFNSM